MGDVALRNDLGRTPSEQLNGLLFMFSTSVEPLKLNLWDKQIIDNNEMKEHALGTGFRVLYGIMLIHPYHYEQRHCFGPDT